jgi:centrosome and spindle pole-associated protein 1
MDGSGGAVPWDSLIASGNLTTLLKAVVDRLDKQDKTIAKGFGGNLPDGAEGVDMDNVTLIDSDKLSQMMQRLDVLENTTLQNRIADPEGDKSLQSLVSDGQSKISLAKHVIPLTALKKRVEGCELAGEMNGAAVDELGLRLAETTKVLHDTLQRELAKMVTKEEFKVLEDKHNALDAKVDKMIKDLVERLERLIKDLQSQVDVLNERVDNCEDKLDGILAGLDEIKEDVKHAHTRIEPLEELMPTKADRAELEAAIQEIRDELEALNIEEIMAMAEKANERLDAMDERCDSIEDDCQDLRAYVLRKEKEMEDLQLEKQIDQLRRELEEAKTGVFLKATQRMDAMQEETDTIKEQITDTQGTIQVNRESIEELAEALREAGGKISSGKKKDDKEAQILALQQDVQGLQQRYVEAAEKEAAGFEHAEKTDMLVKEIQGKMGEIEHAKADRNMVESALRIKADKESVARDTEANQRAVDMALSTMNAGTQGIQQMLEKQEGSVNGLKATLDGKVDRNDLSSIEARLAEATSNGGGSGGVGGAELQHNHDTGEAMYGGYGVSADQAAAMSRPMQRYNCIACQRSINPQQQSTAMPALPLLPGSKTQSMTTTVAYVPTRRASNTPSYARQDDSLVEISELSSSMRSAGGSHTSTRKVLGMDERTGRERAQSARGGRAEAGGEISRSGGRPKELIGEDGRIYQGRNTGRPQSSVYPRGSSPSGNPRI